MSDANMKCNVLECWKIWNEMDVDISTDKDGEIHVDLQTASGIRIYLTPLMAARVGNALRDAAMDVVGDIAYEVDRSKYSDAEGM